MSIKLTLTRNSRVIDQAKRYAQQRKTSVSKLVENYFRSLQNTSGFNEEEMTGTVEELSGVLKGSNIENYRAEITDYLEKKY